MPGRDINRIDSGLAFPDPTIPGPVQVLTGNATIDINGGDVVLNAATITATFPTPQVGIDDHKRMWVIAINASAHVISTAANKLNGNKTSATWTRATQGIIGMMYAFNGVWNLLSYQDAAAYAQYITLA